MRELPQMVLTIFLVAAFVSTSLNAGADNEEKQKRAFAVEGSDDQKTDVRYHLKALEVYVKELEKAEDADRRTNPKYAEEVEYLETRRRLMAATVEDFEMGRASTDDYRRCSEELAELELQSIIRHEERLKAAKAHVARMTELAKTVKARREVGTIGEREMLEGKAAQEKAERLSRNVEKPNQHAAGEMKIRQGVVDALQQHYRKVSALAGASAKGGEAETHAATGREYYLAQARLSMAQGQPAAALSALQAAVVFADRALMATQSSYEVGTAKASDVIAAAKARGDSFRQYWEAYRVFGDPKELIELPDDPFFEGLRVKRAAK